MSSKRLLSEFNKTFHDVHDESYFPEARARLLKADRDANREFFLPRRIELACKYNADVVDDPVADVPVYDEGLEVIVYYPEFGEFGWPRLIEQLSSRS